MLRDVALGSGVRALEEMHVGDDAGGLHLFAFDRAFHVDDAEVLRAAELRADRVRAHRRVAVADLEPDVAGRVAGCRDCLAELAVEPDAVPEGFAFERDLDVVQHFVLCVDFAEARGPEL